MAGLSVLPDGTVYIGQVSADLAGRQAPNRIAAPGRLPQRSVIDGLLTRAAVLMADVGLQTRLDQFATHTLRLHTGERWREALSTALLGDWVAPLAREGRLLPDAIGTLRTEVRTIHRQLVPLWRRRAGGLSRGGHRVERRVLLLETPCAEGVTLRDLLAERTCTGDAMLDLIPGDQRLARILTALEPGERAVVMALGLPGVTTWAEAAEYAGAGDPPAFGERVRRKTRRLAAEHRRRTTQLHDTPDTGLWQPRHEGGPA
ncbi:hypothetical protein LE181_06965 [Streptomyces sp. SCA3-4]|uniref:hypothetical protein n=1 Tax=Streptomyces sichuanensis TaxID=2871810 RepID=UPI001CE24B77|nr:hypothetical protein [Streptomyces sichuanensis]MCA6091903.1 hypothetical protein [Streptomyces sichuanensis]